MKATGNGTAASLTTTGWIPVGAGAWLELPELGSGLYHEIQIRYNPPGTAATGQIEFYVWGEPGLRRISLESGHTEASRDGVLALVGDSSRTELIEGSVPVETSTPGASVDVPDLRWVNEGVPVTKLAHQLTTTDTDASAATLGSGESYWLVLSLKADGTITETKSDKGTTPLDRADIPAVPENEVGYSIIERLDTGITDAVIELIEPPSRFAFESTTGLNLTFGPGRALVGNGLMHFSSSKTVAITASTTGYVWLTPSATFVVTDDDSTPPAARSLLLFEATADGSSITDVVDRRTFIGSEIRAVELRQDGALSAGDVVGLYAGERPGWVRGVVFALEDPGSGNTAGETRGEFWVSGRGRRLDDAFHLEGIRRPSPADLTRHHRTCAVGPARGRHDSNPAGAVGYPGSRPRPHDDRSTRGLRRHCPDGRYRPPARGGGVMRRCLILIIALVLFAPAVEAQTGRCSTTAEQVSGRDIERLRLQRRRPVRQRDRPGGH